MNDSPLREMSCGESQNGATETDASLVDPPDVRAPSGLVYYVRALGKFTGGFDIDWQSGIVRIASAIISGGGHRNGRRLKLEV